MTNRLMNSTDCNLALECVDLAGWQEAAQSLCHLGQKLPHITRSKLRPLDQLVSRVAGKLIEDQEEVKETGPES